jgi:hypothetical protein
MNHVHSWCMTFVMPHHCGKHIGGSVQLYSNRLTVCKAAICETQGWSQAAFVQIVDFYGRNKFAYHIFRQLPDTKQGRRAVLGTRYCATAVTAAAFRCRQTSGMHEPPVTVWGLVSGPPGVLVPESAVSPERLVVSRQTKRATVRDIN